MTTVDPITVSVLWNALLSVADEMGTALRRTAVSPAVREGEDFSTGVFDREGRLIAQGNFTPGHLGSMPFVMRSIMERFPVEEMHEGDGFLLNDSALGSGHFPDFFFASPVFLDGCLIGFVVNTAHHVDIGGSAPGSQQVHGVRESFQEGLRILPIRLVREGRPDADLMRILLGNVRRPDIVEADLRAQLNANHIGANGLRRVNKSFGGHVLCAAIETILEQSEREMRAFLSRLPQGRYSFEDHLEDCGENGETVTVAVDVTIGGGEIGIDFSRSSDQVEVAVNSYLNYTRAYSLFAVKVFSGAALPQNEGCVRPIHVTAREGSFFNPRFPAPSGGRAAIQIRIFEAINGALAQALPDKAMGAFSHWSNPNISGTDNQGNTYIFYDLILGGYGASAKGDGAEGLSPVINCANIPVEVQEATSPIRVRQIGFIPDSGGAGRFRGGCGLRKDVEILSGRAVGTLLSDRHQHQPYGLNGGQPGAVGRTVLIRDGAERDLSPKSNIALLENDVVSFRLSGAGGYGDPSERSPEAIERDLADGFITHRNAYLRRVLP